MTQQQKRIDGNSIGPWRNRWLPVIVLGMALTMAAVSPAKADLKALSEGEAPTREQLIELQDQLQTLAKQLRPVTVGLRVGSGQGSGVIVSEDGYVLTAAHVSRQAGVDVVVILDGGKQVRGKTLGADRNIDAGLIKLQGKGPWPHAEIGKSQSLKPGQWCVALGHPGGYQSSRPAPMRLGRVLKVHALGVETDCMLINGDSGGPLFDLDGKVIGIHSRIGSSLMSNTHVPVDAFTAGWQRMAKGEVWGGRGLQKGTPYIGIQADRSEGMAKVASVVENSPAERAGLQAGDVIVRFGKAPVKSFVELALAIRRHKPGDKVKIAVERDGKTIELKLTIGRYGDTAPKSESKSKSDKAEDKKTDDSRATKSDGKAKDDDKSKDEGNDKSDDEDAKKQSRWQPGGGDRQVLTAATSKGAKPDSDAKAEPKPQAESKKSDTEQAAQKKEAERRKAEAQAEAAKRKAEAARQAEAKHKAEEARRKAEQAKRKAEEKRRAQERRAEALRKAKEAQEARERLMALRMEALRQRERTRTRIKIEKNHDTVLHAFAPTAEAARPATVRILGKGKLVAMGAVVHPDGYVLTKASELREDIEIKLASGPRMKAQIVGVIEACDLALLKVPATEMRSIEWSDAPTHVGTLLVTPDVDQSPIAVGVVSVEPRALHARGFLGIAFKPGAQAPEVGQVVPNTAAAKAKLRIGDVILTVDGQETPTGASVIELLSHHKPGDTIAFTIQRGDDTLKINITLGERPSGPRAARFRAINMLGGGLSDRRSDFPAVIQHDTILFPEQCGGPLVGLDGKVLGINIARAGRVKSYALPAATVKPLIAEMIAGKHKPSEDYHKELLLRGVEDDIERGTLELYRAEYARDQAQAAIEKAEKALQDLKAKREKLEK